jgi:saccharopine dehydrogenase-like NADP-dependent oxidoreductase
MEKVLITGAAGKMGRAICYAMHKLGFVVLASDSCSENLVRFCQQNPQFIPVDFDPALLKPSIVISAAPYDQNFKIAEMCFASGVKYCDLGGHPDYSIKIQNAAKTQCFTDLGLAPGLVNIVAEEIYHKMRHAHTFSLKVGGLPKVPGKGMLKYAEVWSLKGLFENYTGLSDVLENGEPRQVRALTGYERFEEYEAFNTMGGLSATLHLMRDRGVKNCSYKTIRYLGHVDAINLLLYECNLTEEEFEQRMRKACPPKEDMVLLIVEAKGDFDYYVRRYKILADQQFSAMQRATAFPISAVAAMMVKNQVKPSLVLDYSHIDLDRFYSLLAAIDPNFFSTF